MGRASTYGEGASSPQTCCTNCRTVFEVSPELLSSADTRVRCGECLSIFDALANLRDPDGDEDQVETTPPGDAAGDGDVDGDGDGDGAPEAFPDPVDDSARLDVTYADFDLFSGEAELPEVAYLDDTADTADFDFDSVDPDAEETFSDTLFSRDATIDTGEGGADGIDAAGFDDVPDFVVDDESPGEPLAFEYRDDGESAEAGEENAARPGGPADGEPPDAIVIDDTLAASRRRGASRWLRVSMVLALGVLLAGLYLYRERERLHNDPLLRPLLVVACRALDCEVPSRVALDSLKLLDKEVFTHPEVEGALVIEITFRNAADFAQRYPLLVVRLRDRLGRAVAERGFAPEDYLEDWTAGDTLAAGQRLDISLEVGDPGREAESYEFEFREASG